MEAGFEALDSRDAARRKWRRRFLALGLGMTLPACCALEWMTYTSGTQQCRTCGVEREAYRNGPFWLYRARVESGRAAWERCGISICETHDWARTGCWSVPNGVQCYFGIARPQ